MYSNLWTLPKRRLAVLVAAVALALAASYSPILLDGTTGTSFTTPASACQHTGGGC